jgi:hypothetical protein
MNQDGHGEKVGQVGHLDQVPDSKSLTYIYIWQRGQGGQTSLPWPPWIGLATLSRPKPASALH